MFFRIVYLQNDSTLLEYEVVLVINIVAVK